MPYPFEEVFDDIHEKLNDLIHVESRQLRLFNIAEVDHDGLRIKYEYENGVISGWHPWASLSIRAHHPPVVGEVCMMIMQHGEPGLSVALCGVRYTPGYQGLGVDCVGDADVLQDCYRFDRQTGELRLGTSSPDAEVDAVALASKVKAELDAVKAELEKIRTALATAQYAPGPGAPTTLTFPSAYEVGYEPKSPGSESTKST